MPKETTAKKYDVKRLVISALFCALAYAVVFVFRIKVGFLTFDCKDMIITIGAMYLGPTSAVLMSLVVSLLEMLTVSDTLFYGFIMNFVSSVAFSLSAALIYKYKRNISGAIIGLSISVIAMTAIMLLLNLFITPLYSPGVSMRDVVEMIPKLLLPFNIAKALSNAALVLLFYKPFTSVLTRSGLLDEKRKKSPYSPNKNTLIVILIAAVIISVSAYIFFFVLKGTV